MGHFKINCWCNVRGELIRRSIQCSMTLVMHDEINQEKNSIGIFSTYILWFIEQTILYYRIDGFIHKFRSWFNFRFDILDATKAVKNNERGDERNLSAYLSMITSEKLHRRRICVAFSFITPMICTFIAFIHRQLSLLHEMNVFWLGLCGSKM